MGDPGGRYSPSRSWHVLFYSGDSTDDTETSDSRDGTALYKEHRDAHKMNFEFETRNMECQHSRCSVCRQVSTNMVLLKRTPVCKRCRSKTVKNNNYVPPWLPLWVDDSGTNRYNVPECLTVLREGEKLLIQRISTYVPLRYMKGGAHGSKGHVCSFPKEIQEFVTELPRKKVEAIKVIRKFVNSEKEIEEKTFTIRKTAVLTALYWLKKYNKQYKDIVINEDNLNWMEGRDEADLSVTVVEKAEKQDEETETNTRVHDDDPIPAYGVICHDMTADLPKKKDQETTDLLEKLNEHKQSAGPQAARNNGCTMDFPPVGAEAVNEYDESIRIFCMAFPWLFPGGVGDWADIPTTEGVTVEEWARALLFYEDGRFARDKIWCFYALNYVQRRQNMKQGAYFVKEFLGSESPKSLDELKAVIEKGDTSWIDKICYFGNVVKGSPAYWRQRRDEIHSWIQYHVLKGNGAPTMFLTLSCAEHYWPDIRSLLQQRQSFGPGTKETPAMTTMINDYTLVIQEYFQQRVKNWMETVGKVVFKIKHYWLRFEFAPGRGQIHAHCLLILDNMETQKLAYEQRDIGKALERDLHSDMEHERARIYQDWVERDLAMTANLPAKHDNKTDIDVKKEKHPAYTRLHDVKDLEEDGAKLLLSVQNHMCTNYCMKKRKILYVSRTCFGQ
jgi:hypothetical protein